MLKFKKITIQDRELLNSYLLPFQFKNCDFCFSDIFLWKEYYHYKYAILEDICFIMLENDDHIIFYPPLGNIKRGIEILIEYTRHLGIVLIFTCLEDSILKKFNLSDFTIQPQRQNVDYIYLRENLVNLTGSDYRNKRNFCNQFAKLYPNYGLKELIIDVDFYSLLNHWMQKEKNESKKTFNYEKNAILLAIENLTTLNLKMYGLYVDDRLVSFEIGTIQNDTFICHFEKADTSYKGSFQMINNLVAKALPKEIRYINREEDLGIPNLRKAKLTYHPCLLPMNYNAYYKADITFQIKAYQEDLKNLIPLWQEAFMDGNFGEWFFINMKNVRYYVAIFEGAIAGMVSLINHHYIYALAVKREYQHLNIGSRLIKYLNMRHDDLYLAIDDIALEEFYLPLGFQKRISSYETKVISNPLVSKARFAVNKYVEMKNIYDSIPEKKPVRSLNEFKQYLSQPNIKNAYYNHTYAIYYRFEDHLFIEECLGNMDVTSFAEALLKHEKKDYAIVLSNKGNYPHFIYTNNQNNEEQMYYGFLYN